MYTITDLRAISEGYSADDVSVFGGAFLLTEAVATVQEAKLMHGELIKSAKAHMKKGKTAVKKGDNTTAVMEYRAAIRDLKALRKEADKIEDDNIIISLAEVLVRTTVPFIVPAIMIAAKAAIQPVGVAIVAASVVSFIMGNSKSFNWDAATSSKTVNYNRAGKDGKVDIKKFYKISRSRGDALVRIDRLISVCEKAVEKIEKSKSE